MQPHPVRDRTTTVQSIFSRLQLECLSDQWRGWKAEYEVRCARGHHFKKAIYALHRLKKCPFCCTPVNQAELAKQLQDAARTYGGLWLNLTARTAGSKYDFTCAAGHFWRASGSTVLAGSWCPYCAPGHCHPFLDRLAEAAQAKGGALQSKHYAGGSHSYRFRCKEGHEWEALPFSVLNGSWCRACYANKRRLTLEIAQQHARDHGGECLATHYVDSRTKMPWSCKEGHQWFSHLTRIRSGHWCPECKRLFKTEKRPPAQPS